MNFECLFAKGASKSAMNDRFYKGSEAGFCSLHESNFPQGILRFPSMAKVHHRMLINMLVLPMNSKVFQHHMNASRNAYKHNAF